MSTTFKLNWTDDDFETADVDVVVESAELSLWPGITPDPEGEARIAEDAASAYERAWLLARLASDSGNRTSLAGAARPFGIGLDAR